MWIEIHNLQSKLVQSTQEESEWLADYLSFPDEKAKYRMSRVPAWKRGDGKIHMLNGVTATFPAGFTHQVKKAAEEAGYSVQLLDKRRRPIKPDPSAAIDWLRSYQREAIDVARATERGVFHHPTGAGKTELLVALGEVYPTTWLILTHRKDLLTNTSDRFLRRTGEVIGTIGEGVFDPRRVTVAMFQSIFAAVQRKDDRMYRYLRTINAVAIDEVHIVPAATYWRVLMQLENAFYRYGFSGTPFARGDKKSIFTWGAVGPVIHRIKPQTLIDAGVLAKPEIRMARVAAHAEPGAKTWNEAYSKLITHAAARNDVVLKQVAAATKPCLLFVNLIEHGKNLERALRAAGTKVEFVWGQHHTSVRRAAIERLIHGETDVLICNVIFQEGIDIPELQSVVIAQGGKSIISALQRVGRGMRKHDRSGAVTKETFRVYDIQDVGCGCKTPHRHMACRWLEQHSRARVAAYASAGYSVITETL